MPDSRGKRMGTLEFVPAWSCLDAAGSDEVCAFWAREHASVEGEEARHRVKQVVIRVLDHATGELAAVSTAKPLTIPRLRQPMYYYRCFIGTAWRGRGLVRPLLLRSFDALEHWSKEHGFPCIGVLLELENESFKHALQRAYWPDVEFAFIGCSPRGLDLRVRYFRGAKLKKPR